MISASQLFARADCSVKGWTTILLYDHKSLKVGVLQERIDLIGFAERLLHYCLV